MLSTNHRPNQLLTVLTPDEQSRLAPLFEPVDLPMRLRLCSAGSPITHAVFPIDAVASTLVELPEGDSVEVGLMGREGFVGLDLLYGARDSLTTVIVQVPGHGVRMKADDFQREIVAKQSPLFGVLLRYGRTFNGLVAQTGACNASHSLVQRLARWLLMCHDRVVRDRYPITHEFIAFMLGVRRATVTEAANALRMAGAIEYERGEMHIVRRERLELSACGCYEMTRVWERELGL